MQQTSPGLRESKKLATRRTLSVAARELAVAHGLDGVTVEMVSERAGVSVRTFFNYFESKEAAIVGDQSAVATDEAQAAFLAGGPSGDLLTDLVTLLDPTATFEADARDQITMMLTLIQTEPRVLALQLAREVERERVIAGLIATRRGLAEVDNASTTTAAVAQTVVRHGCSAWLNADDDEPLSTHLERAATALRSLLG